MTKSKDTRDKLFDFKKLIILLILLLVGFGIWKINQSLPSNDLLIPQKEKSENRKDTTYLSSNSKEDTLFSEEKAPHKIEIPKKDSLTKKLADNQLESKILKLPVNKKAKRTKSTFPKIEIIAVQGGIFQMGSNKGERDEKPVHSVTVSDFKIGKYEITQKIWKAVMKTNPSYFKGDSLPVEQVSWNKIQEFLSKLNKITGKEYRLPTESEWEFAAKGGTKSRKYRYSGSNISKRIAWNASNSDSKTHNVGTKKPNELGIYDMSGNVWEWCQDKWSQNYKNTPKDGTAYWVDNSSQHLFRGGSWFSYPVDCRLSKRNHDKSNYSMNYLGFRVLLVH